MLLLWLLFAPILLILLILYFEIKNYHLKRIVNRFGGPPSIPLFGNTHHSGKTPTEVLYTVFRWWHQYGKKNFRMWIGYHPFIIIAEPKDVEFVLSNNSFIHKSEVYEMLHPWLGEGLLTSAGIKWHKHRKMITPSFHFKILQNMHEVMNKNSTKFIEKLEIASMGETIFDFQDMVHYFTLDVICDTAMGVNINAMENHDSELVAAFKDMCYSINMRAFHPIKRKDKFFKFFPEYLKYRKTLKVLKDFTYDVLYTVFRWWHQYGKKNFRMWIGYHPFIIIAEPKDVEFVLSNNSFIHKSEVYEMLHPWLGEGLLTSAGIKWHKHRKMITPSFHFKILQNMHEVMNKNSTKFIEKLEIASMGETIFDFQDMVHYFTLDVICDTAMGVNINAMENHDSELVAAFKDMCYSINMRAFHPIKRKDKFFKFFPEYLKYRKTLKVLKDFTYDVIKKRIKTREENGTQPPSDEDDFLSRQMLAFLDTLLTSTIDNRPLTLDEVYEEVSTFMFEEKVYAEQENILGPKPQREATFQEIAEMQYLDLVIKEAQRLYPSVPLIARRADKDYNMNGKIVPMSSTVNIFIMALGYNDQSFPDPYRFDPERFDNSRRGNKINPFEYVPFSAGPRNCIGQKFALLELKTIISKIVRTFEILPPLDELWSKDGYVENFIGLPEEEVRMRRPNPNKYDPLLSAVLTLKSENGISIRLRKR